MINGKSYKKYTTLALKFVNLRSSHIVVVSVKQNVD